MLFENGHCFHLECKGSGAKECTPMRSADARHGSAVMAILRLDPLDDPDEKVKDKPGACKPGQYLCQGTDKCVTSNWLCDGQEDCPDGDDERQNCTLSDCGPEQLKCSPPSSVQCVPQVAQCDGKRDCDNGEDEAPVICNLVDTFSCLPNRYRCPGTRHCIHVDQICDSVTDCPADGADEGAHCVNHACRSKKCPDDRCKETFQGPLCYCQEGKEWDGTSCRDMNECEFQSFCDQGCVNKDPGYSCSCDAGYEMDADNNCHIPADSTAQLAISNFRDVQMAAIVKGPKPKLTKGTFNIDGFQIATLDIDIRNQSVCWITFAPKRKLYKLMCADVNNKNHVWEVKTQYSLKSVKAIAKDWISQNWYFADEMKEMIFLCTPSGSPCQPVLTSGIRKPVSLALDATRALLFYADWSNAAHIGRMDFDGQNVGKLASIKIVHPNGLTVDIPNRQLYWGDSFINVIERCDYDGRNRKVIAQGPSVSFVFGMSILEQFLYVANHFNKTIVRIHRYQSDFPKEEVMRVSVKPGDIKVYHPVAQPYANNDLCSQAKCEQLCIPVHSTDESSPAATTTVKSTTPPTPSSSSSPPSPPNLRVKCECFLGYQKSADGTCKKRSIQPFLILTNGQQGMIQFLSPDPEKGAVDLFPPIVNLGRPVSVTYDPIEKYVYFSDKTQPFIGRRKLESEDPYSVYVNKGVNCEGLALDYLGRNLYCADSGRSKILAVSLRNNSLIYTVVSSSSINVTIYPKAMAVDINNGVLYWTNWKDWGGSEEEASINRINLDGSGYQRIWAKEVQLPNGLTVDKASGRLYWVDAYYDKIYSILGNGTGKEVVHTFPKNQHPYGLAKKDNHLFWSESLNGSLMLLDLDTNVSVVHHKSSPPIFDIMLEMDGPMNAVDNPCVSDSLKCSDFCLIINEAGSLKSRCQCADGRTSLDGGVSCQGKVAKTGCGSANEFTCKSGQCIPISKKCDGTNDCADQSDEDRNPGGPCQNVTCPKGMFRCNSSLCLYQQFVCDGEMDCSKGEDELNCTARSCPNGYFPCNKTGQCIPNSWKCDGKKDCPDNRDEEHCCENGACGNVTCGPDKFQCQNGRCINYEFRCDNEYDCTDNSDEMDCRDWCDPVHEFKCANGTGCISKLFRCNGKLNCPDGSDEVECEKPESHCHEDEFVCADGTCLKRQFRCDDNKDCFDGSDEIDCDKPTGGAENASCHWMQFRCEDGSDCIPSSWQCDEDFDCADKSDEKQCDKDCQPPNFACKSQPNICISPDKLCDNRKDCPDFSDEGRLCTHDFCVFNDCEDKCHRSPYGYVCSCPENKRLHTDLKTCVDIDICASWGICSQMCERTDQGHRCYCLDGYALEPDGYSCKPVGQEPAYVIFSNRHEIRRINLYNHSMDSLVQGLHNTIALDFHYKKSLIFWTDVIDDKIYRGEINGNRATKMKPIVEFGLATTEGIAIDWITDTIYWVESYIDHIELAKLDGSNRTTLIAGNLTSPRAIVLDPRVGKLFWTDWAGSFPRIESCSMAGEPETRQIVYDIRAHKGSGWPNGLTVDYQAYRLYWVDARSDSIHTITYEGKGHHLILKSHQTLSHPFSLSLFGHQVFWTDWKLNTLVMANKFNGSDLKVLQRTYSQPFDLQIFHPMRQPQMKNPCEGSKCSHLCLIGQGLKPVCRCPHRFQLSEDGLTCKEDNTFLLFVKEKEIQGVDLDNAHYNVIPSISAPWVENVSNVDYDVHDQRLYWTDWKKNVITSAYLNGTGFTTIIDSDLSNPAVFAIDWMSRNMYFSSYTEEQATISVAQLDGAFRTQIFRRASAKPNSIAIHPSKGLMFWSDIGGPKHAIWKAQMDGRNASIIVEGQGVNGPTSLSLDFESDRLYWINQARDEVFWCSILSQCVATEARALQVTKPMSMTIYQKDKQKVFLFYANSTSIIKYQGGKSTLIRKDTAQIHDLHVYDPDSRQGESNGCTQQNGGCEQLCLPAGGNTVCACTVGFKLKDDAKTCQGLDSFMLYSQASEIHGITLDSSHQMALATISKISKATSVDFHEEYIYWVDSEKRTISRIKRNLSARETIVSEGLSGVEALAVDWIGGHIYWTDLGHKTIEMSKLDGSDRLVVVHDHLEKPRSLALHPSKGYFYYADRGVKPKIVRARLDGSDRKDFVVPKPGQPMKNPYALAIDYATDDLYWCDRDLDIIERVEPSGKRTVVWDRGLVDCVSLTVYKDKIYWADSTDLAGSIKFVDKVNPTKVSVLKEGIPRLKDICVYDENTRQGTNKCQKNNGGCQELCLYVGNGQVSCACSHSKLAEDGKSCEEYNVFLLYSEVTSLKTLMLHNTSNQNAPRKPIRNVAQMKNVIGLAFDHANKRIFFSDIQLGNIQSVLFNGTGFKVVLPAVGSAEGLAFEPVKGHLYWTSYSGSNINRITFHPGGNVSTMVVKQLSNYDHPRDIVISSCIKRIFWTNWSDRLPSIQSASYLDDQKGPIMHLESLIIDNIRTPNGLALDHKEERLYWSDATLDKIERCNLDGSNRVIIVSSVTQHSFGLAIYGNFLYWTDWILQAIIRVNKYTGSEVTWLKKTHRQPMGLVAVAEETDNCTLNPCYQNAFECSDICFIDGNGQPKCACKKGMGLKLLPDGKRCVAQTADCADSDFVCEDQRFCIDFEKTCNGFPDCLDASDESHNYCSTRKCPPGFFQCQTENRCLPMAVTCNGQNDCPDGSDEVGCPCADNEFQCTNGMCILDKYRCDSESDCFDHSDEIGCDMSCDSLKILQHQTLIPCNTTSMCIYPEWICDGTDDCWDNNDESNCDNVGSKPGCSKDSFRCDNGECIMKKWVCDREDDCNDNSDEANCNYTCQPDEVACSHSICVPQTWVCDGHPDCPDSSDEFGQCNQKNCTDDAQFHCPSGRCIPPEWVCDGDSDCPNGEDERVDDIAKCQPIECDADQMSCLNRKCLSAEHYCDGINDCGDNSDEPDTCVHSMCGPMEFHCKKDFKCIKATKRCNGYFDCPDHSDEDNCPTDEPHVSIIQTNNCPNASMYQCKNKMCIDTKLVCNGYSDCSDDTDERHCGINECKSKRPVCSQQCIDLPIGYRCQCFPGYQMELPEDGNLNNINRKCVDVDECATSFPCSHYCINTVGSFKCHCAQGYMRAADQRSCIINSTIPVQLLVTNRFYMRLIYISPHKVRTLTNKLKNSVAVDYDWKEQMIYWSDITTSKSSISRIKYNFTSYVAGEEERLHHNTVRNPDGLAVDWIGRNLYWCDKTTDTIEVSLLDGRYRRVLLRKGLQEPRALEVFPQKGLLFFTDWGDYPHISRMNMDGTGLRQIINESIAWPNALTIDYVTEKIFWADGSLDYIGMSDLEGRNARVILGNNKLVPHIFALTTFENHLYWTDWEKLEVFSAHKFTGLGVTNMLGLVHRPMDIQVVHPGRQQQVPSPCHSLNCTHLCLLRPDQDGGIEGVCACPENHHLAGDQRSCLSNCTSSQFLCASSSKCIPFWWHCDGNQDCEDGSDEPEGKCAQYHCIHHGMFQCENATSAKDCLLPTQICDGIAQCVDKSDEKNCEPYMCMDHFYKCHQDSKCIQNSLVCDGQNDCTDGQDELNCTKPKCTEAQFECGNGRCIPYVWKCDTQNDCGDGSDEPKDCLNSTCRPGHSQCKSTGKCFPEAWKCDHESDCGKFDLSDEDLDECHQQTCDPNFIRCRNGQCIPKRWKCDNFKDCSDGSDEVDCEPRNCTDPSIRCNGIFDCADQSDEKDCEQECDPETQFQCKENKFCITKKWLCDGDRECPDGSDEWNCDRNCSATEFKCKNTVCLSHMWLCDGDDDCGDGSDEDVGMCAQMACAEGRFRCREKCIWNDLVCDSHKDCQDGEDEDATLCNVVQKCTLPEHFLCKSQTRCIAASGLCNGTAECPDGSDEGKAFCVDVGIWKKKGCGTDKGGCQHFCSETSIGALCSCKKNFVLNPDGVTCSLENPCLKFDTCPQACNFNSVTMKVNCSCHAGYKSITLADKHSCLANGPAPQLLLAERSSVVSLSHLTVQENPFGNGLQPDVREKMSEIIAIDTDIGSNLAFFINHVGSNYYLMKQRKFSMLNEKKRPKREAASIPPPKIVNLPSSPQFSMQDIAVDWVNKHLYITDDSNNAIHVYKYGTDNVEDQSNKMKTIVRNPGGKPHAITVDPVNGHIFWTVRTPRPMIYSASLDGSKVKAIVSKHLAWPNSIAADTAKGWIFWADPKKHTIEAARYSGTGRQTLYSKLLSQHPAYALDVFEDYIYALTSRDNNVLKLDKYSRDNNGTAVFYTTTHAKDLVVVQKNRQQIIPSNCSVSTCDKSQMCFNVPNSAEGHMCLCPEGAVFHRGKCNYQPPKTCEDYCFNGATCTMTSTVAGKPMCSCPPKYVGERCDVPACKDFCLNSGECTPPTKAVGKPTCNCPAGFSGDQCESYACTNFCQNGGKCQIGPNGKPSCLCSLHYGGDRCQIAKSLDEWCPHVCKNNATCRPESSGYVTCICNPGFTGKRCEQCIDLTCPNQGACYKNKSGRSQCRKEGLDCGFLCSQGLDSVPDECDCSCAPVYEAKYCKECKGYCLHGTCVLANGKPSCDCGDYYKGGRCERCKCETTGTCHVDGGRTTCRCKPGHTGQLCETALNVTMAQPSQSGANPIVIAVVVTICLLLIVVVTILVIFFRKRRRRLTQFGHKRMEERGGNLNMSNPIYMKQDVDEDEDDDEYEPLEGGGRVIFTGTPNGDTLQEPALYDAYSADSLQKLMSAPGLREEEEENHNNYSAVSVQYLSPNHQRSSRKENGKASIA